MTDQTSDAGALRRGWRSLWRHRPWLLGAPPGALLMVLLGAGGVAATDTALHATSRSGFCFGCHSIETNVRPEWEASSHFSNASGVRAECADCHLPQDDHVALVGAKLAASLDVFPELAGVIDTPEKFEARRAAMAERVWAEYRENDSHYCRSCHEDGAMAPSAQSRMARAMHARMIETGKTCIDCHRGLVHRLPEVATRE